MNTENMIKGLADISYTPISKLSISSAGELSIEYSYPEIPFLDRLALNLPIALPQDGQTAAVNICGEYLYYGIVLAAPGSFFLLGPTIELPVDNLAAQTILKTLGLPASHVSDLIEFYESTPHHSLYRFAQIVIFLNNSANENTPVTVGNILPKAFRREITEQQESERPTSAEEHLENVVKSQNYELELYSYVYAGQYERIKSFISQTNYTEETGQLSASIMRQNKYFVITSIALASRAAVRGGVNYNVAMQQADKYYRKVDEAVSFNDLFDTHKQMLLNYTKMVADRKLGKPTPPLFLRKVQQYIELHLTEKITTEEIAKELQINRSYLSTQFKKECGSDLNDYINRLKIDEAKRLLLTTDMPLITIATTLGFSSQSHFAAVFKRMENMTPTEFVKKSVTN